jgi:hypothetical protein
LDPRWLDYHVISGIELPVCACTTNPELSPADSYWIAVPHPSSPYPVICLASSGVGLIRTPMCALLTIVSLVAFLACGAALIAHHWRRRITAK